MTLSFNKVVLRRISSSDIEMLRNWRNSSVISERMFFKDHITKEMQFKWFQGLKETDFYFVISYKNEDVGLINLSNENTITKEAESGLFIAEEKYWGGPVSIYASLALLQFAFCERKLNTVLAKVREENSVAKKYNALLGFEFYKKNWQKLDKLSFNKVIVPLLKKLD